jgi:hypothetical protein
VASPAGSSRSVAFWDDAAQRRPHSTPRVAGDALRVLAHNPVGWAIRIHER